MNTGQLGILDDFTIWKGICTSLTSFKIQKDLKKSRKKMEKWQTKI